MRYVDDLGTLRTASSEQLKAIDERRKSAHSISCFRCSNRVNGVCGSAGKKYCFSGKKR